MPFLRPCLKPNKSMIMTRQSNQLTGLFAKFIINVQFLDTLTVFQGSNKQDVGQLCGGKKYPWRESGIVLEPVTDGGRLGTAGVQLKHLQILRFGIGGAMEVSRLKI